MLSLVTLEAKLDLVCAAIGPGVTSPSARPITPKKTVGKRRAAQREALAHAIGPVWEANHVWLIFLVVLLFTCFPAAYAQASVALFWPLHAVLIGIVLRGAAFVFTLPILAIDGDDVVDRPAARSEPAVVRPEHPGP